MTKAHLQQRHRLGIANDGHHQSLWRCRRKRNVDKVAIDELYKRLVCKQLLPIDNLIGRIVNDAINGRLGLKAACRCLDKSRHETKFLVVCLFEEILNI